MFPSLDLRDVSQAIGAVVIVFAIAFVVVSRIAGDVPEWTAEEEAQVEFARADPYALLPTLDELPYLPWDLTDCTEENTEVVALHYDWDFDPLGADDLESITVVDSDGPYSTTRVFCYDNESWAMFFVLSVPDDKSTYDYWRRAAEELADRSEKSLELVADAFMQREADGELVSAEWLPWGEEENLGRGASYIVEYEDYGATVYDYDFMRGPVSLSFHMSFHASADVRDETMAIASSLDRKVRQALEDLLPTDDGLAVETQN